VSQDNFLKPGQQFVFLDPGTRERRQFTIVRPLGRGAFAQSFLASGEAGYAVLKSSVNAEGENIDLETEAQVLCELNHPNVVRYYGTAFDHQWRIVLAFERLFDNPLLFYNYTVETKKLKTYTGGRYHPLPLSACLDQLMDLLSGLESMQAAGYVHADVKPANFMLHLGHPDEEVVSPRTQLLEFGRGQGRGVLIDVGGSWTLEALEEHNAGQAEKGPQLTPLYAPPEALLDDNPTPGGRGRLLCPSMDTYSAALVFYLCLTGQAPYAHHASLADDLLEAKRRERRGEISPIDPSAVRSLSGFDVRGMRERELTDRVVELLLDWLNPDPERRTSVAKARRQLEDAFDFAPNADGLLRQRVAKSSLYLPPAKGSAPRGRPILGRRSRSESGRVTKRVSLDRQRPTTRRAPALPEEATPSPSSPRAPEQRKTTARPTTRRAPALPEEATPSPSSPRAREQRKTTALPERPTSRRPRANRQVPDERPPKQQKQEASQGAPSPQQPPAPRPRKPSDPQARPPRRKRHPPTRTVFWLRSPVFPRPFALEGDRSYVLGRAGKADLPIPSNLISRRHACLSWDGALLLLQDLESTNGTTLDGRPLDPAKPARLRHGAHFSLGGFEVEVLELPRGKDPSKGTLNPDAPTRELKLLRPAPSS
jgi:serine/threonine protein kinase